MKSRLLRLAVYTAVLLFTGYALKHWGGYSRIHDYYLYLILFFAAITGAIDYVVTDASRRNDPKSPIFFIGSVVVRFVLSAIIMIFAILLEVPNAVDFIVTFFVIYLFFLVFELYALLANLRPNSETGVK